MKRREAIATLAAWCIYPSGVFAQAKGVAVVESFPAAYAQIGSTSSDFLVRFDRPVDHVKSKLVITRNGREIETLHPRLESAPEVLFARAPTLAAGDYLLHWSVITLEGAQGIEGDIPFKVSDRPSQ
ncbi:copper resistance CopC family protein [Reyranella sp.]|uniref:copper resistance CopC family protein n=1 Tax=Reyranella sp. TaxID=1929291 RepID=UPI003D0FA836